MHLLVDMNLSRRWIALLSKAGHGATYWRDVGAAHALDDEIMAYARSHAMVVVTRDLDFGEILAANKSRGPSVVQLRDGDSMPSESGARVVDALNRFSSEIDRGALVTVHLASARVRLLPIDRVS